MFREGDPVELDFEMMEKVYPKRSTPWDKWCGGITEAIYLNNEQLPTDYNQATVLIKGTPVKVPIEGIKLNKNHIVRSILNDL